MTGSGPRTARSRIKSAINASADDDTRRNTKPSSSSHHRLRKDRNQDHSLLRIFNTNIKVLVGFVVSALSIGFFVVHHLIKPVVEDAQKPGLLPLLPRQNSWIFLSFKGSIRRACIGEHIGLKYI